MHVELREVQTRGDLIRFIRFPFSLYQNHPFWVPPMISEEYRMLCRDNNPAFGHCEARYIMAFRDGKMVGRIAGIINREYIRLWGRKEARFCWFDFVDDPEVSTALLRDIELWAMSKDLEGVFGPMGFTTFEKQGVLVEGFDKLATVSSVYNYQYYAKHLERLGYAKDHDYVEYDMKVPPAVPDRCLQLADAIVRRYKLKVIHPTTRDEIMRYGVQALGVINEAYHPLVGFVPLTRRQIDYILKAYYTVIHAGYLTLVLDDKEHAVGFQIAMPSLSKALQKARGRLYPLGLFHIGRALKHPESLDMLLVGVVPEYQNKGLNAIFMSEIIHSCNERNISHAESNGMLEENTKILQYLSHFEAKQHKRRRLYYKSLN